MKVKALTGFAGVEISMYEGQELDLDEKRAQNLSQIGYVKILNVKPAETDRGETEEEQEKKAERKSKKKAVKDET